MPCVCSLALQQLTGMFAPSLAVPPIPATAAQMNASATAAGSVAARVDAILVPLKLDAVTALSNLLALPRALATLGSALPRSPCAVCQFLKAAR